MTDSSRPKLRPQTSRSASTTRESSTPEGFDALFQAGREAWPSVHLDRATFRRYALARSTTGAPNASEAPSKDLYLACACVNGDANGLKVLDREFLAKLPAALARLNGSAAFADEVVQILRVKLLVGRDGRGGKLSDYAGRGPLLSWLRASALRTGLNLKAAGGGGAPARESEADELPSRVNDPELDFLKSRYQTHFNAAFEAALLSLPTRDKNVLRRYLLEGKNVAAIGAVYQVDRTTVTRWIVRARKGLLDGTRQRLIDQLGLAEREAASLIRLLESRIDVSISRVLREGT